MKPPAFDYHAPTSISEAIAALAHYGGEAKVLAGGQSLMPLLNMRLVRPAALVDINRIASLEGIRVDDGRITVGALTRQRALEEDGALAAALPLLGEIARYIGHPAIRNRGTVGGSLAHGDPAAELPCAMLALEAALVVEGPRGARPVPAERFHRHLLTTDLAFDELLTGIEIPVPPRATGHGFAELTRRFGDFAVVGAVALITLDPVGRCCRARVALAGVAPTSVRARRVEAALEGDGLEPTRIDEAVQLAREEIDPPSDLHAPRAYREAMTAVMIRRAVLEAARRARTAAGGRNA